ncbi:MAG: hypothetical protein ACLFSD_00090 [Salinivenus sp.]
MNDDQREQFEEHLAQAMALVPELEAGDPRIQAESGLQRAHATVRSNPERLYKYCEEVSDGE